MTKYLKFDKSSEAELESLGVSFKALRSIFLCEQLDTPEMPELLAGMTPLASRFAEREFKASWLMHSLLAEGVWTCVDPVSGDLAVSNITLTSPERGSLPLELMPLFYGFNVPSDDGFWICVYGTYGRATQVFFPRLDVVVFDVSFPAAELVVDSLLQTLKKLGPDIFSNPSEQELSSRRCVGLLDMVTNFGHQMINHLSGVERLIEHGLLKRIDQVWLCGGEFFGPLENIFPELNGRVRRFKNRWEVFDALSAEPINLVKIGSTYFSSKLSQRITAVAGQAGKPSQKCLVVTIRADGRRCLNLADVVAEVYSRLRVDFPDLKIALDGWVFPESELIVGSSIATATSKRYVEAIRSEVRLAQEIGEKLPAGSIVINTIGRSTLESVRDLAGTKVYLAHVGTLQHKLGFLVGIPGVVHGPTRQLRSPEGGSFLSETGCSPTFMPAEAVEDVETDSTRGQGFSDYRILDVDFVVDSIKTLLS